MHAGRRSTDGITVVFTDTADAGFDGQFEAGAPPAVVGHVAMSGLVDVGEKDLPR
jgi:hypothetical protein